MAWVCDYCGGPPDGWTGGQGAPYRCAQGCERPEKRMGPRMLMVAIPVAEEFIRDAHEDDAVLMLGREAYDAARKLLNG